MNFSWYHIDAAKWMTTSGTNRNTPNKVTIKITLWWKSYAPVLWTKIEFAVTVACQSTVSLNYLEIGDLIFAQPCCIETANTHLYLPSTRPTQNICGTECCVQERYITNPIKIANYALVNISRPPKTIATWTQTVYRDSYMWRYRPTQLLWEWFSHISRDSYGSELH